mmetsp:Transcript_34081/g.98189  ORF Transcript_34081/g.98189 Transcript_34081/m.98189 type:complete len:85 (+) Transcript_34081:706-960(+)
MACECVCVWERAYAYTQSSCIPPQCDPIHRVACVTVVSRPANISALAVLFSQSCHVMLCVCHVANQNILASTRRSLRPSMCALM